MKKPATKRDGSTDRLRVVDTIMKEVDRQTEPSKMSKEYAIIILNSLQAEIDIRVEALTMELEEERGSKP